MPKDTKDRLIKLSYIVDGVELFQNTISIDIDSDKVTQLTEEMLKVEAKQLALVPVQQEAAGTIPIKAAEDEKGNFILLYTTYAESLPTVMQVETKEEIESVIAEFRKSGKIRVNNTDRWPHTLIVARVTSTIKK